MKNDCGNSQKKFYFGLENEELNTNVKMSSPCSNVMIFYNVYFVFQL